MHLKVSTEQRLLEISSNFVNFRLLWGLSQCKTGKRYSRVQDSIAGNWIIYETNRLSVLLVNATTLVGSKTENYNEWIL